MNGPKARLDLLHSSILSRVVGYLGPWDIEVLSCVNKRLRAASLPVLFRAVKFEFSKTGLNGLKRLSGSDIRQYVVSLTYVAPEILKPEILNFESFGSEILTPDDYVDCVFGRDSFLCEFPSYMLAYDVLRDICEEQRNIVGSDLERIALSSIFTEFPTLESLNVWFCRTIEEEEWIESVLARGLTTEESREYYYDAIRNAIKVARESGSIRNSICLSYTELPT
ncbi:hypothetical protein N7532_001953 [Penicillium argentinense]|uniref:F-box domain-containing protein n=1 Tax=Penicillium argentinense TaxID=1131581 RepID=A0A9W9KMX6_9EURO|nr:uncharacterized protein N7532_001953 [Penicillium argentinense]KAJ5111418.1 hypothetical protein N7532_001953 [Penicillium argentinense]